MRKINNRKSLILAAGGGKYVPNIVRGGNAIPLGNNFYYIKGRKHSAGGVDIGADPKTGLEVEGEEVMKVTPKEVRVYSSVPFLQGNSPAELVMGGANPDAVFNAQEEFKDRNRINDDGTKYENGGKIYDASKNYERAAKAREWTDALVGLFGPTPISGVLDIINARNNDRSNAEMVLAGLSVLPGARVLSKLTRGLGRLTKNQSLIKEGKKISDIVNRDKTLQKAISSFNQSARDGTLAERMRRREIYTPGGDIDLDRIQGEHIKNYNKAIHYFDRYNKLSDSNWANYENFAAASRGINTTVDAYNIGKESVNLVTDENKTNKKKLGGNGRVTNVDGKQSDRYKNDNNNDINQHFVLRSLNRNNVGNNKTVTDILTKDGIAIRFEEAPYSKVDSLVANSIIGDKSLWNAHHLVKSVRAELTSNPFKYIYNTVENVTNGVYEELLGNIIGKDKAIDVKFHGNINKKELGGNKTIVQQDAIANYKPDLKYNNYENFEKAKSNAFDRALEDSRLQRKLLKASVQIADPTGLSTSVPAIIKGITGNSVPSDWLDVLGSVPRVRSLSNLLRYRKNRGDFSKAVILKDKENEYRHLADEFVDYATKNIDDKNAEYAKRTIKQANDILKEYRKADKIINPIENAQYAVRGVIQNQDIRDAIDSRANKKPLGGNLPTNQNDFLDTWNASRLATGRYNNQLGDGRLERQAESRNTAREFHSPIGFAMNYGKRAAIRTPSMSDTDYRKEIARNAQSMKLRLNTPETGQGVIGGAYHAPTHSSYVNQEEFTKDSTVRTHENAHASRATEQEQVISDILGSSSSSTYLRRPTEVYSRLMQFRQANNLDPNTVYDKDSFRELRKTATDYNLINTFKEDEVIDLLNNVAMRNDPNQLNLNNINLNTVPVYAAKYGTKRKSKMGKVISINGNVRNGLIHTPSREAFAYGGERKPRFNGRYSKPGLHNLSLLASAIIMPKGTVDKEPEKPRRVGWADLHNRLVTADISQKPLDAKQDNTSVAHVISETEKRTRKFAAGGRKKAKAGKDTIQTDSVPERYYIPLDKANLSEADLIDFAKYARAEDKNTPAGIRLPKSSLIAPKNIIHTEPTIAEVADFPFNGSINAKSISRAERNVGARGRLNTEENGYNKIEELLNRVRELGTDAQGKNDVPMTFDEYTNPQADYTYDYASRNNRSIANLNRLGITPRLYGNPNRVNTSIDTNIPAAEIIDEVINNATKNVSSSTGGGSSKSGIPVTRTLDNSKVTPASNAEMAGIARNLAPTVVNRLTKNANNDINYLSILDNLKHPYREEIAKTRNLDNIQFGINLGSSVMDALMSNIFVNQLHSYTPPTITAPTISNPGEIKLNEEDLKDIPEPILMAAAKLKTRYNANPQLAKIEDETRRIMRDIDRNTSNSRVGLARKQLAALRGQEAKNQVYAQKENIETELINKDKLNQQEVTARNLARYDQYNQALAAQMANRARLRLAADTANIQNRLAVSIANANLKAQADQFNAGNRINSLIHQAGIDGAKAEARANIVSSLLGNVGSAFDVWNRNKRRAKLDEETLKVLGLRAPNVNKLMLRTLGINK